MFHGYVQCCILCVVSARKMVPHLYSSFSPCPPVIYNSSKRILFKFCTVSNRSQKSAVCIGAVYGLDDRSLIPGRDKRLFSIASRLAMWPTQPPTQWYWGSFLGIKRPGLEADRSRPSSAEVKNGGAIPPLFHMSSWRVA
jgi:hypothetical protein